MIVAERVVEHLPVLMEPVLRFLSVRPGGVYVDCTLGLGGHTGGILGQLEGRGRLIALERDGQALQEAEQRLRSWGSILELSHENFRDLPGVLARLGQDTIDGCLLDLGVSSLQLDDPQRGFSFRRPGPLDMRMDRRQETTAAHLVNRLPQQELADLFWTYGEEKSSRKIAAAIVQHRENSPIQTTTQLAEIVSRVKGGHRERIHPATRVFQALRIQVNGELDGLEEFLTRVVGILSPHGRLVVISFHSLEDRLVKTAFRKEAGRCVCFRPPALCSCPRISRVQILTRKPVTPSPLEVDTNPRARSAKLRAVERLSESTQQP